MRSKARVRVKPKRHFYDPSLPAALLGATPDCLLHDTQTLGMLFENLIFATCASSSQPTGALATHCTTTATRRVSK